MIDFKLEALVNPFNDLQSGSPDRIIKPTFEQDDKVNAALDFYLNEAISSYDGEKTCNDAKSCISQFKLVLTPSQINLALQKILATEQFLKLPTWHDATASLFLKKLVQDSYDKLGFDSFSFDSGDFALDTLFFELKAKKEKPMTINLNGNAGMLFANNSEYCRYYIRGSVGRQCGGDSFGSEFYIRNNVGENCGHEAENSLFNIEGDAGKCIAMGSMDCQFSVAGNTGHVCGMDAKGCIVNVAGEISKGELASNAKNCVFVAGKMEYDSRRHPTDSVFVTLDADKALKKLHGKYGNEVILV